MAREQRLVFGEDAEAYDRARPHYPGELIDDIVGLVGPGARVVDAGCGTARLAVPLAQRGLAGVGVEPHPAMASIARRNLAPFPDWRVDLAGFEDWPAEPAELVTSAMAWKWIDVQRGLRKVEEILAPGGWLAIVGHDFGRPAEASLRAELDAIYEDRFPESDPPPPGVEEPPAGEPLFAAPMRREYRWSQTYTTAEWLDLIGTWSNHRLLPEDRRRRLFSAIAGAIDARGGSYVRNFVTRLWAAQRV